MGKKVVAILSMVALLFTMIPADGPMTVQAATKGPIILYDLNTDTGLDEGNMASTALQKAGNPTINVVKSATGSAIGLTNVVNSWDGLDLKPTALKQSDGSYTAGSYTFTVTGHVDPGVASSYVNQDGASATLQMILGMSEDPYSWFANQAIDPSGDGSFTLTYSTTYSSASELANLGYNYRIQKNGEGLATSPTSFYIDGITVSVIPSEDEPSTPPDTPDNTLPVGSTATLYDMDKDTKLIVGGSLTDSSAFLKSGDGTVSVEQGEDAKISLLVKDRVNNWDGIDLLRTALKNNDAYYTGDYVFTVKGHIDPADIETSSMFVLGMSQSPWGELASRTLPSSDGTFTLTYTKNYTSTAIDKLNYDYRIQTSGTSPASFYIDSITVTVTGTAPKVKELYAFPFNDQVAQGSSFASTNSSAQINWVNQSGVGKNDDTALQVTHIGSDYTGGNNAVRLTLPKALPEGGIYKISAWVYIPTDENTGKGIVTGPSIVLNGDYSGDIGETKFPVSPSIMTLGTWEELKVTLPRSTTAIKTIDFYFDTNEESTHPEVWLFDDIVISQLGDIVVIPKWDLTLPSMAEAYKSTFLMGNIMSPEQITDTELIAMYKKQYNVVTAENAMKPQSLSSEKDVYNYTDADKLVSWAEENGIQVHAHTLVWHSQSADWLTKDSQNPLTRAEAKDNMQSYINNVAGHFAGKVISWDVVNEAFANDVVTAPEDWKAVLRGAEGISDTSPWYAAYANGADVNKGESGADFIYDAFVFTRLADPSAKLFYNDYNETEAGKCEAMAMMVEDLNAKWKSDTRNTNSNRQLIEGIGMQAHYWTGELNPIDVENTILRFIKAGADISVSELDIPVGTYPTYKQNTELTAENEAQQAELYKQLFKIYVKYAKNIDRVTIWGKADSQSWRFEGYPTLFDDAFAPKDAFYKVMEAAADIVVPVVPGGNNSGGSNSGSNNNGSNNNQEDATTPDKPDTSKDDTKTVQAEAKSLIEAAKDNELIANLMKDKTMQGVFVSVTESFSAPKNLAVTVEGAKAGQKVYIYRVNKKSGKLETVAFGFGYEVDEKGNVSFLILEGGNYVVLTKKAEKSLVTSLTNQIKISKTKSIKVGISSSLKVTLPTSLELTKKLKDKTKMEGVGAVVASYKVSNPSIATVNKNGKIVAKKAGKTTITTTVKLYNGMVKKYKTVLKVTK